MQWKREKMHFSDFTKSACLSLFKCFQRNAQRKRSRVKWTHLIKHITNRIKKWVGCEFSSQKNSEKLFDSKFFTFFSYSFGPYSVSLDRLNVGNEINNVDWWRCFNEEEKETRKVEKSENCRVCFVMICGVDGDGSGFDLFETTWFLGSKWNRVDKSEGEGENRWIMLFCKSAQSLGLVLG